MTDLPTTAQDQTADHAGPIEVERPSPVARHRLDLVSFFFGLGFIAVALAVMTNQYEWASISGADSFGMLLVVLGGVGATGLIAGVVRTRGQEPELPNRSYD